MALKKVKCMFCFKKLDDYTGFIASSKSCICDDCIDQCYKIKWNIK